jgi:hypothetical protein
MVRSTERWLTPTTAATLLARLVERALPPELQALLADIATGRPLYLALPP